MYLKIEPIKGQSTVEGFKEQIECLSFSHGVSQSVTNSVSNNTRTVGRPRHQDFAIQKYLDESSPEILDYCNKGEDIKTAIFTLTQEDGKSGTTKPIWTVTMTKALITSTAISGGMGDMPMESVTFNYATIKWEFEVQTSDAEKKGKKAAGWSLEENKAAAAKS